MATPTRAFANTKNHQSSKEAIAEETHTSIAEVERRLIVATLEMYGGNKRKTADILGVSLKTLYNRLNTYREV